MNLRTIKITFLFLFLAQLNLFAQYTSVPDDNFEQALIDLGYDSGPLDNQVLTASIDTVTFLNISNRDISNSIGLENFTALMELRCEYNQLTSLDISKNTALTNLWCSSNNLNTLDLSNNTKLTNLSCYKNQLNTLDVSKNLILKKIRCNDNLLGTLNVSKNTKLEVLWCHNNQITGLDLSKNTALWILYCNSNKLSALDMRTSNNSKFVNVFFNTKDNPNLICIFVDFAPWSTANWKNIDAHSTFVGTQTECDALYTQIPDNNFEQILIDLGYDNNPLDSRIVTANINTVITLNISEENISDLAGIEDFKALNSLICGTNQLSTLDVSKNTALKKLKCSNNSLNRLDIRNGNNSNILDADFIVNNNPNLPCIFVDDAAWSTANWTNIDSHSAFVETEEACDAILGIEDKIFSKNVLVFPNPTSNKITIQTDEEIESIAFYNVLGEKESGWFAGASNKEINISLLSTGTYFIKIISKNGAQTVKKVIKN